MPRALVLLALVACAALAAPGALAHRADAKNHFTVTIETIPAGGSLTQHMTFEEGPLRAHWIVIFVGGVVNGTELDGALTLNGTTVHAWKWTTGSGKIELDSTSLPQTSDFYAVTLTNPTDAPEKIFFYFDQSCDCYAKPLPFAGAYALFNFDFLKGETAWLDFDKENVTGLQYSVLTRPGDGGAYPQDFRVVKKFPADALPNGTMTWSVPKDERYYFLVQSTGNAAGSPMVTPRVRVSHESAKGTPGVEAPLALAAALAVAALARRAPKL